MSVKQIFNTSAELDYPKVLPTLDLDFANTKALDPRITFTRASGGSYVGADGLIKYAGVNEPRFDHDPLTGESLGFLIEGSKTNLITYSQEFDNAAWSKQGLIVTSNFAAGLDGTITADKLIENAVNTVHLIDSNFSSITSGITYTSSVYAKAAERSVILIQNQGVLGAEYANFNLSSGSISLLGAGATRATIQNVGNGWYRCSLTSTAVSNGLGFIRIYIQNSLTGNGGYQGDGTSGIFLWGAQLEEGAFPTSYIPTVASTRTRAADVASITGTNFSSWFNSSSGSLVSIAKTPPGVPWSSAQIIGGFGNGIYAQGPTGTGMLVKGFYSQLWQTSGSVWILGAQYSLGGNLNFSPGNYTLQSRNAFIAWSLTESRYGINGELSSGSSSSIVSTVAAAVNRFIISGDGIDAYYGTPGTFHVKRLTFYPKRLPDAQLQTLTR